MSKISIKNLAEAIYESSLGKSGTDLDLILENSVKLMKEKGLLSKKEELLAEIQNIQDKKEGRLKATIKTKSKLKQPQEEDIKNFLKKRYKAKEVILEKKEDEKLYGGIKIEIKDEIIDATLSTRINQLQNYLIKG